VVQFVWNHKPATFRLAGCWDTVWSQGKLVGLDGTETASNRRHYPRPHLVTTENDLSNLSGQFLHKIFPAREIVATS
jgi:hypothetical protein